MSYEAGGSLYTIGASSRISPGPYPFPSKNEQSLTQRHLKSGKNKSVSHPDLMTKKGFFQEIKDKSFLLISAVQSNLRNTDTEGTKRIREVSL